MNYFCSSPGYGTSPGGPSEFISPNKSFGWASVLVQANARVCEPALLTCCSRKPTVNNACSAPYDQLSMSKAADLPESSLSWLSSGKQTLTSRPVQAWAGLGKSRQVGWRQESQASRIICCWGLARQV